MNKKNKPILISVIAFVVLVIIIVPKIISSGDKLPNVMAQVTEKI